MSDYVRTILPLSRVRGAARVTLVHRLVLMWDAVRTRRLLAEMDPRLLKDIGISRSEADAEASRAPWDIGPRRVKMRGFDW